MVDRLAVIFVGLSMALSSAAAFAEVPRCAPDYDGVRGRSMDHDGAPGVWIAAPVMRCIVADLAELQPVRRRVVLLEEALEIRTGQVERLRRAVQIGREVEQRTDELLDQISDRRQAAERRLDAWWRSPALWYALGVVTAGAVVALVAWGLSAAD